VVNISASIFFIILQILIKIVVVNISTSTQSVQLQQPFAGV